MKLISVNSQVVYSFGGQSAAGGSGSKSVFKYTRSQDKWTVMPELPLTADVANINCAKVMFRSKHTVLCFGSSGDDGKMIAFDLATETWKNLGMTADTPPHILSLFFVVGDTLYR